MRRYRWTGWMIAAVLIAGCGPRESRQRSPATDSQVAAVFAAAMPEGDPTPIPLARARVAAGDTVIVQGRIMGMKKPFAESLALFVLGDEETLTPCNERPGDNCPTPWDVCCDTREARLLGVATIQVLDANGDVVRQGLRGANGLQELSRVRVAGVVAPESQPEALIVNAQAVRLLDAAPARAPLVRGCCPGH